MPETYDSIRMKTTGAAGSLPAIGTDAGSGNIGFLASTFLLKIGTLLTLVVIALLGAACAGCSDKTEFVEPKIEPDKTRFLAMEMGGVKVTLEISATDEKRHLGLMKRKYLEENHGMLFVYPEPQIMRFYMRDTWIPLSIAFLKDDGTIINIEKMRPNTASPSYLSKGYCRFAIEMNQGWFEKHGLRTGDKISMPQEIYSIKAG